jgi:hypothetical protein
MFPKDYLNWVVLPKCLVYTVKHAWVITIHSIQYTDVGITERMKYLLFESYPRTWVIIDGRLDPHGLRSSDMNEVEYGLVLTIIVETPSPFVSGVLTMVPSSGLRLETNRDTRSNFAMSILYFFASVSIS